MSSTKTTPAPAATRPQPAEPLVASRLRVGYVVNQYPQTSASFVRRELLAMEALGTPVERYAIRRWGESLVDPRDRAEVANTKVILGGNWFGMIAGAVTDVFVRPAKWWRSLKLAWRIGSKSDRGRLVNLLYLVEASRLRRWCERDGVDWLHAHFGTNSAAVAMLCHSLGGPRFSATIHGPEEFDRPDPLHLATKIAAAGFVVGISSYGRSQLYRYTDIDQWSKIHVVHCGLGDDFLDSPPTLPTDAPKFVTVSRLHEQKGIPLLVEAVAKLVGEGIDVRIDIIGDGPLRAKLEQLIARHGVAGQIRLLGWQSSDTVREALLDSRGLVLPSFAEGLPVVVMESLALHRPVITTRIAGMGELVEHGTNGWLVMAGDVDALAAAIRDALERAPEELLAMGSEGADRVRRDHRATTESRKLLKLIEAYSSE